MNLYGKYENRIQKLAKVKNLIVRFRVLILCALFAMIATISTLLIIKGIVVSDILLPEELRYGDEYSPQASAIMSGVSFEYAEAGTEEWTQAQPQFPGKYLVRTVTDRSFGKGYGACVSYEIKPRRTEFIIKDDAVLYGGVPEQYSLDLINGDRLVEQSLRYAFGGYAEEETSVSVITEQLQIVNVQGEDISSYYEIFGNAKNVRFIERRITVVPLDMTKEYDGTPLDYADEVDDSTAAALSAGDSLSITTVIKDEQGNLLEGNPVDAGTYTVEILSATVMRDETDITARYGIASAVGTLRITPRPITVTTASAQKIYDGTPLSETGFTQEGLLTDLGHRIVCDTENAAAVTDYTPTPIINRFSYRVTDGAGRDITHNYAVTANDGTLTVDKRAISVSTASAQKVYDGTPLMKTEFTAQGELAGHTVLWDGDAATRTNVGTANNRFACRVVDKDTAVDKSHNYEITYTYGTLQVTPLAITVTLNAVEKFYDNAPFTVEDLSWQQVILPNGMSLQLKDSTAFTMANAGEHTYTAEFSVYLNAESSRSRFVREGAEDITQNFAFNVKESRATIYKSRLDIALKALSMTYSGAPFDVSDASGLIGGIFATDRYNIPVDLKGDISFRVTGSNLSNYVDCGTYDYTCMLQVLSDGEDIGKNFDVINVTGATLNILQRDIVVRYGDLKKVYDGKPFENDEILFTVEGLPAQHSIVVTGSNLSEFVGYTEAPVHYTVTAIVGNEEINKNYLLTPEYGTVDIAKRSVSITTGGGEKTYDGAPLIPEISTADGLAEGHTLREIESTRKYYLIEDILYADDAVFAGQYTNVIESDILDGQNKAVTENYVITYSNTRLEIFKRKISVTPNNLNSVSYGEEFAYPDGRDNYSVAQNLAQGDKLQIGVYYTDESGNRIVPKDVGKYYIHVDLSNSYSFYQGQVRFAATDNYQSEDDGTGLFEIVKLDLDITPFTDERTIYGDEYTYPDVYNNAVLSVQMPYGEQVKVKVSYRDLDGKPIVPKNAGEYLIHPDSVQYYRADGVTAAKPENYNYRYFRGRLKIEKRSVKISQADWGVTYGDENPMWRTPLGFMAENLAYGEQLRLKLVYLSDGAEVTPKNAGKYVLSCDFGQSLVMDKDGNEIIDGIKNYDATEIISAVYTVWRRDISIELSDMPSAVYGDSDTKPYQYFGGAGNYKKLSVAEYADGVLPYGEKLEAIAYFAQNGVELVPKNAGDYSVCLKSFVIYNADGTEGASQNYALDFAADGLFTIEKRHIIKLVPNDMETVVYDGYGRRYQFDEDNYSRLQLNGLTGLPYGEHLKIGVRFYEETEQGQGIGYNSVHNAATYQIYFHTGLIVTRDNDSYDYQLNYILDDTSSYGTFIIAPRKIEIAPSSLSVIYGEENPAMQAHGSYTLPNLADGEQLDIALHYQKDGKTVTPKNVGEYDIAVDFELSVIKDTNGNVIENGLNNYNCIKMHPAKLTVQQRELKIQPSDLEIVYGDENPTRQTFGSYSVVNLAYNEQLDIAVYYTKDGVTVTPKNAGCYSVLVDFVRSVVKDENGEPIEDGILNYKRTGSETATLTIAPRVLTVKPKQMENAVYGDKEEYLYPYTGIGNYGMLQAEGYESGLLPYGEQLEIVTHFELNGAEVSPRDAHTYDICPQEYRFTDSKGIAAFENNYSITPQNSVFVIEKRHITKLAPNDMDTVIYDGQWHRYRDGKNNYRTMVLAGLSQLPYGESIDVSANLIGNNSVQVTSSVKDSDAYRIYVDSSRCVIYRKGYTFPQADGWYPLEDNYILDDTTSYGTFIIEQRPITLTTDKGEWEYDGNVHSQPSAQVTAGSLATASNNGDEHTISPITATIAKIENADSISNTTEFDVFEGTTIVTKNYKITYVNQTLTVTKRQINVTTVNGRWEYDGTVHSDWSVLNNGYHIKSQGQESALVKDHVFEYASDLVSLIDVDKKVNRYDYRIVSGRTDVSGNYDIVSYTAGEIEVFKRKILLITNSNTWEYDGDEHSHPVAAMWHLDENGNRDGAFVLVTGHEFVPIRYSVSTITDAGETPNTTRFTVYAGMENIERNYDISYGTDGTLTVTQRKVRFITPDATWTYDGSKHSTLEYEIRFEHLDENGYPDKEEALVKNHLPSRLTYTTIVNVDEGEKENNSTYDVLSNGVSVANNYNLSYTYGTLKVTPAPLTVTPKALPDLTYGDEYIPYLEMYCAVGNYASAVGLVANENIQIDVTVSNASGTSVLPPNAGEYMLTVNPAMCAIAGGQGKISNYTVAQGEEVGFTIMPRTLEIAPLAIADRVYDGTEYTYPVENGNFIYRGAAATEQGKQVVTGESIAIRIGFSTVPRNAGEYTGEFVGWSYSKGDGYKGNYQIICNEKAHLVINKKTVTFAVEDVSCEYTAAPFDTSELSLKPDHLAGTDQISAQTLSFIDSAGNVVDIPVHAGNYLIQPNMTATLIYNRESGETLPIERNYIAELSSERWGLTITPRAVTVIPTGRKTYDGTDGLGKCDFEVRHSNGADGMELDAVFEVDRAAFRAEYFFNGQAPVDARTYSLFVALSCSNEQIADDYVITYEEGNYLIYQRHITVLPVGKTEQYGGQVLSIGWKVCAETGHGDCNGGDYGLLEHLGHTVSVTGETLDLTKDRSIMKTVSIQTCDIYDAAGKNITGNYHCIYRYDGYLTGHKESDFTARLTFTQRIVKVELDADIAQSVYGNAKEIVYNGWKGSAYSINLGTDGGKQMYSVLSDTLVAGHTINALAKTNLILLNETQYSWLSFAVNDDNGNDVTAGYLITYVNSEKARRKMVQRNITIQNGMIVSGFLADDDELEVSDGQIKIKSVIWFNGADKPGRIDVTKFYNITVI